MKLFMTSIVIIIDKLHTYFGASSHNQQGAWKPATLVYGEIKLFREWNLKKRPIYFANTFQHTGLHQG